MMRLEVVAVKNGCFHGLYSTDSSISTSLRRTRKRKYRGSCCAPAPPPPTPRHRRPHPRKAVATYAIPSPVPHRQHAALHDALAHRLAPGGRSRDSRPRGPSPWGPRPRLVSPAASARPRASLQLEARMVPRPHRSSQTKLRRTLGSRDALPASRSAAGSWGTPPARDLETRAAGCRRSPRLERARSGAQPCSSA